MDWVTALSTVAAAIIAVAGRDFLGAIFNRRRGKVDAAQILADTAIKLNSPLRAEFERLHKELVEERRTQAAKVAALNVQIDRLTDEAGMMANELRVIRTAVFAPDVTIDGLRELIRQGPNNPRQESPT